MSINGHRKLSAIGAATAAMLRGKEREQELAHAAQVAAERLPLKDAVKSLTLQMDLELDRELKRAAECFFGAPLTDPEILRGRMTHGHFQGDPGLTYFLDGTPVLWVGPAAIVREGDTMKATRSIRQLLPALVEETPP